MFIIKWIVRGIGVILVLMIVLGVISFLFRLGEAPSISKAPWAIQTYSNDEMRIPSRYYYAESVDIIDGTPVITGYWTYDGKKYRHQRGDKAFPLAEYGNIDIVRRKGQ